MISIVELLTEIIDYAIMKTLGKSEHTASISFEPKEGGRTLLPSSKSSMRSPSLDYLDTSADDVTEDMIIKYLVSIMSDIYMQRIYGNSSPKTSGDLLQSLNERAG